MTVWGRAGCSEPGDWEEEAVVAIGWTIWKESWAEETASATGGLCLGIDWRCRQAGGWGFLRERCPGHEAGEAGEVSVQPLQVISESYTSVQELQKGWRQALGLPARQGAKEKGQK